MRYHAGDQLQFDPDGYYVYGLLDDRGRCFYVGVTSDPAKRLREHIRNAFNARVRSKMAKCQRKRLVILSNRLTQKHARELEAQLIRKLRGLLNQEHRKDYRQRHERHPVFEQYLRAASKS